MRDETAKIPPIISSPPLLPSPLTTPITPRLECEMKRLRSDLQITRNSEHELRAQLNCNTVEDKSRRNEVSQLRLDNSSLQNKLTIYSFSLLLSDLGNAGVIIEAVLLIETITPIYYLFILLILYIYIYIYISIKNCLCGSVG